MLCAWRKASTMGNHCGDDVKVGVVEPVAVVGVEGGVAKVDVDEVVCVVEMVGVVGVVNVGGVGVEVEVVVFISILVELVIGVAVFKFIANKSAPTSSKVLLIQPTANGTMVGNRNQAKAKMLA